MSMQTAFPKEIPLQTREIVEQLLPPESVCRLFGEKADELINEEALVSMYAIEGRGGINPVILSIVTVLQFMENNPDRQAEQMVLMRMDWKYALRQELTWEGFDYSSLCNFRKRLHENGQEYRIFEDVIRYLAAEGYIKSKRQRTDATHVLGAIERLSRLELVWETLRLALEAVTKEDADWVEAMVPPIFVEFHSEKREDYRLSKAQVEKSMQDAGRDGFWFLEQIDSQGSEILCLLEEVELLRRVLHEQFIPPTPDKPASTRSNTTACGDVIASPHDVDVRYSKKGEHTSWEGYKAQVTETVDDKLPLITDIAIHSAIETDNVALETIQERLAQRQLTPEQQYVDRAYCNGATIESSSDQGIDLRGYVASSSKKPAGYRLEDFDIDIDTQTAICPQGKLATSFKPSSQDDVAFHVRFGKQCHTCLVMDICTSERRGRSLEISPHHETLARRRLEQKNDDFREEMHARARIESTICELVRKHQLRQSRYRGMRKANLQAAFTATAVNLKRFARYIATQNKEEDFSIFQLSLFSHTTCLLEEVAA